jgi:lysine 2,3-aminomutase
MKELCHKLVMNRVRPYYLYQCDLVHGAGHFRTPVATGIEIMEALRGHTSGYAIPTYVVDAPGGGGKIPVMPNYVISQSADKVVMRNYEGYISAYTQPEAYTRHDPKTCPECIAQAKNRGEMGQRGVNGLLAGERLFIAPEGFTETHERQTHEQNPPEQRRAAEVDLLESSLHGLDAMEVLQVKASDGHNGGNSKHYANGKAQISGKGQFTCDVKVYANGHATSVSHS